MTDDRQMIGDGARCPIDKARAHRAWRPAENAVETKERIPRRESPDIAVWESRKSMPNRNCPRRRSKRANHKMVPKRLNLTLPA
jgi:hypothetical protein